MNKKLTLIALALCATFGRQLKGGTYSATVIFPEEVYCPTGMTCGYASAQFYISTDGSLPIIGGSSVTEELYDLNVPTNKFVKVSLSKSMKLPFAQYPALGKQVAFELAATKGKFAGIPFRIVVRTEVPSEKFISKIERGIKALTDKEQIAEAKKFVTTLRNLKNANKGINTIYRAVHSLGETKYKLWYPRIPGERAEYGYIIARPDGNLELHEADPKQANKELITVIDTGVLM